MKAKTLTLGLICLLMLGCALSFEKKRHIDISWKELFPDCLERVCVFVKGAKVFRFTSHYENMVHLNVGSMEEELKRHGYKIEDIEVVIHSHFIRYEFSGRDEVQYRRLKKRGFNGLFLLYCHITKEIYDIEDKKKDLT